MRTVSIGLQLLPLSSLRIILSLVFRIIIFFFFLLFSYVFSATLYILYCSVVVYYMSHAGMEHSRSRSSKSIYIRVNPELGTTSAPQYHRTKIFLPVQTFPEGEWRTVNNSATTISDQSVRTIENTFLPNSARISETRSFPALIAMYVHVNLTRLVYF